jgi:hypothetical protein
LSVSLVESEEKTMANLSKTQTSILLATMFAIFGMPVRSTAADGPLDYRILATSKTSTMEKELNEAAEAGYRFDRAMGGRTANGGQEVVVAMVKKPAAQTPIVRYKLLATSKMSTMQKELQEAAEQGYEYLAQTVFETAFGGKEVVVILELDPSRAPRRLSYRLLATSRTSTMEKELKELGELGYCLLGLTVGETAFGGNEIVAILGKD